MNSGNAPLGRDNIDLFIDTYAPSAYKSSYRVLADATRTELVLIDSFVEAFHQRNMHSEEDPVFVFADILEERVRSLSEKYPVPDHVVISQRSLDDFTKSTIKNEVHKRINSVVFRTMDLLMSSASSSRSSTKTSGFASFLSEAGKVGVNLMLVLHIVIISIVIFASVQFISMSIFDVGSLIANDPFSSVQKNLFQNVDALKYMPIQLQKGIVTDEMISAKDKDIQNVSGSSNTDTPQNPATDNTESTVAGDTSPTLVDSTVPAEDTSLETSLSATRG